MADIFQIDYEQMEQITAMFKAAAEATEELRGHVNGAFEPLESGDWRGEGFSAFANTMNRALFPAFDRLLEVFVQAARLTDEVAKLIRAAEEEAAAVFEGESEGFLDSVGDFFSGAGDAIGDFFSDAGEAFGNFWKGAGEWVHGGLDVLGFIPGFGEVADGINGLIYLAEGRYLEAGISFAAMIPIAGDLGKLGKWGVKGAKAVAGEVIEEGIERAVKEVTEEIAEEGTERVVREGVQEGGEQLAKHGDVPRAFGGRGTHSGRPFDPDKAGGPILNLTTDRVRVTDHGINYLEKHISRFGSDPANQHMVERLRKIARGEMEPTSADLNFYTHELRESVRYRKLGWPTGQPSNADEAYDLWNNAHTATLEDYKLKEGPGVIYHPDAAKLAE